MRQLQTLSSSAVGQKSAIQAANEIALHQTHQLKKLEQTIMTQANMQGEFIAKQNEEKALKDAMKDAMKAQADTSGAKAQTKLPF
jgi:P-type conjugative transfer protein TrbJ